MMKELLAILILTITAVTGLGQSGLQKIVDSEHAFARLAAEKGTRTAFLAYLEDDALIFNPGRIDAKPFWTARAPSAGLLSWAPNYADAVPDGSIGYTTGNWEFRPKGKDDTPSGFGEFITIWRRQSDGTYKWSVDIGIGHPKPDRYSTDWTTSKSKEIPSKKIIPVEPSIDRFVKIASEDSSKAYAAYAADDIRSYREDQLPFLGRAAALRMAGKEKGVLTLDKPGKILTHQNLAYFVKSYSLKRPDGSVEIGDAVQIWKFTAGKWKIVLDILKPVPAK